MSMDKNPEVVGCDASIMKNVWEIRTREHDQKMLQERERIEKSALPSINQDWAGRLAARLGGYKRAETKPRQRVEIKADDIWKSKEPMNSSRGAGQNPLGRPAGSLGAGSSPLGRPARQSRSFSTASSSSKERKVQEKHFNRLQLLMSIAQSQPSAMVWGKSWKYNKSLPSPAEGSTAGWGQCWMFAIQQPTSEEGKPWPNGPNKMDPQSLHLWSKTDYRMMESLELVVILLNNEWQMSWKRHSKDESKQISENVENIAKFGFFATMVETQQHNEIRSSSEWSDSWRATKPRDQDHVIVSEDGSMNESNVSEHDRDSGLHSKWEECWRFVNYQGGKNAKPKLKKHAPEEWLNSWKAAMTGFNNHKKSGGHDLSHTSNDHTKQKESDFHKIMSLSHEPKYIDLCLQLCNEIQVLSEWSESWQVTKNNTEPCEEIQEILKQLPPNMETAVEANSINNNTKAHHSQPKEADPFYEQLKHDVLYQPKSKFTQSGLFLLKNLDKMLPSSEWRDSWKVIKHRKRMERRRMRINPLQPFRESENSGDIKPTASEWKDSWKSPRHSLHQEPDMWQQGWPTVVPVRVNRATDQDHFPALERPKNGPSGEPGWGESWRFFRRQPGSQSGRVQATQTTSDRAHHHPDNSWRQGRRFRGSADWQPSWMVSENQFHHDNPSLTQWREAWMCSTNHTQHWSAQHAQESWVDNTMEIHPLKERVSLQSAKAKMSRSFDNQVFRERYPEKEWKPSWNAGPLFTHQTYNYSSLAITGKKLSNSNKEESPKVTQNGTKWGRSFRLANPMPQMEQQWVESYPNPSSYTVMWRRGKKMPVKVLLNFSNNPATFKVWVNSHRLLQGAGAHNNNKSKSQQHTDSRVIITNQFKAKKHLYSRIENAKQSEKKWAGCHLLGKTQPRPKKSLGPEKKMKPQNNTEDKFFEEWAGSWRFLVSSASLKKQKSFKSLSGWNESWKFLLPLYQPVNGPKTR